MQKEKSAPLIFSQVSNLVFGSIGKISAIAGVYCKDSWLCSDFFENEAKFFNILFGNILLCLQL